ncbi:enoyl-CoA hydratase/isomerase family protein [Erythrobacter insulae]|uniref:Enoyl-CoA hydratase/isomerase family protein n=1 Tax=Erythrobacter insulae TaxID=2584124 RepID=A0A547PAE2_9SPHN|nr:enoyl-CoA hydratase-related protein [Erythrobacter insulae]TRD11103.1 enoyl-CoA hydratase/isomerase family protein [Erythrobacter insulae]
MTLRLQIDGAAAHLVIDRADKRNSFNMAMWQAMPGLLEQAARNSDLRLLIVRSAAADSAFCAGADIKELLANKDDGEWCAANQAAINRVQHMLARHALPTIAFVEGDCIGGGCGIALACDLRIATPAARFGITPAKLGLVYPMHDVKLLTDLVGPGQAKRLLYTGNLIDASEALRIGLIEQIADSPAAIADQLLSASPHSIREMKRFVRRVLDGQSADDEDTLRIFAEAFAGSDFFEGTTAFVEKRKARFGQ